MQIGTIHGVIVTVFTSWFRKHAIENDLLFSVSPIAAC